jgi:hypothetical protein
MSIHLQRPAQRLQLVSVRPVQLLRLALAPADEAHLVAQGRQPLPQSLVLGAGEDLEAVQGAAGFCEGRVRLARLLAQQVGAVFVAAEADGELLLELGALVGRGQRGVANGLT